MIKVAKEAIVDSDDDISADRLKNAAATKKLAIFDAFEILSRIEEEEILLNEKPKEAKEQRVFKGFAEGRSIIMYEQSLYKVLKDHIKPKVLKRMNRYNKWEYGYNKEHDIVVISRTGKIGDIYEIQEP